MVKTTLFHMLRHKSKTSECSGPAISVSSYDRLWRLQQRNPAQKPSTPAMSTRAILQISKTPWNPLEVTLQWNVVYSTFSSGDQTFSLIQILKSCGRLEMVCRTCIFRNDTMSCYIPIASTSGTDSVWFLILAAKSALHGGTTEVMLWYGHDISLSLPHIIQCKYLHG